jgi:hypothetical protein
MLFETVQQAYLLGISFLVIGSYPTQFTFAFSQLAQLGSCRSHRFFRDRHRLHAETLRKTLLCPDVPPPGIVPVDELAAPDGDMPIVVATSEAVVAVSSGEWARLWLPAMAAPAPATLAVVDEAGEREFIVGRDWETGMTDRQAIHILILLDAGRSEAGH